MKFIKKNENLIYQRQKGLEKMKIATETKTKKQDILSVKLI